MTSPVEARPPAQGAPGLYLADPEALPELTSAQLQEFWDPSDCPPHMIRLLTVQAVSACRRLAAGERLTGSVSHVPDDDIPAYSWMSVQVERLGWEVVGAPVWAWARVDFEGLVSVWPSGAADDVVVLVIEVPLGRTVLSAFDPWQELLDEGAAGTPSSRWAHCLDIADFPRSALQAVLPFIEAQDVVRACRLRVR